MKHICFFFALLLLAATVACKKDNHETERIKKPKITGAVEKGPFLKGSQVSIVELTQDLNPTGRIFKTEILNDLGHFEVSDLELVSPYVQVLVDGFYFNEVTGSLSNSRITLGALVDVGTQNTVNVNAITHLEQRRVKRLMQEGATFAGAKTQASKEILEAFYIGEGLAGTSDNISIVDNNRNAASLLAVSAVLLNAVSSDAALTEKLSSIAQQIESGGKLDEADDEWIKQSIRSIDMEHITSNVTTRYHSLGITVEIPDFLDLIPPELITEEDFFTDEEAFVTLYGGALESFFDYFQAFAVFEAAYANTIDPQGNSKYVEIAGHQFDPANAAVYQLWAKGYQAMNRFSLLVQKANDSDLPKAKELLHYANAHRGYLYWSMMTMWGDVPYLEPSQLGNIDLIPRTRITAIIDYLVPSLEATVQHTQPEANEYGMGKSFPLAVLARLSLLKGDYAKAKQYTQQIIQTGLFNLSANQWAEAEKVYGYTTPAADIPAPVNQDYRDLINGGDGIHYVTYPEIVLTASEACLNLGEINLALGYLNQVRQSNGKQAMALADEAAIRQALLDEIKDGLGKDGLWFSTLKRHDKAEEVLSIPAYRELIPIPQQEIILNSTMAQNPGY